MRNIYTVLIVVILFSCGKSKDSNGVVGTWEVNANGIVYQITLNADSTLTETLFGTTGKWLWKAADSTQKEPAHITFVNEAGTDRWFYLDGVSETSLNLRAADNPISLKRAEANSSKSITPFDQFRSLFTANGVDWVLVPLARERIKDLIIKFVPERASFDSGGALVNSDTLFVATVFDYMSSAVAVFNTQTQERLFYKELFRGEGCNSSYKLSNRNGQTIIELSAGCEEGGPSKSSYVLDKSGKLVAAESGDGTSLDPETEKLLRRLIGTVYKYDFQNESAQGSSITYTGKDNPDYSVEGSIKQLSNLMAVVVSATDDMAGSSQSGVFKKDGDNWISQFSTDLMPGEPDRLIDLNGDGKDELIMHQNNWNSAGAQHIYTLFAKTTSDRFEKISDIATSAEGYSEAQREEMGVSTIEYVPDNGTTKIRVTVNNKDVTIYMWDGAKLTKK